MPNCDYYCDITDHRNVLDAIFTDNMCSVYELSSDYGQSIRKFDNTEHVLNEFNRTYGNGKKWHSVCLQIFVHGSGKLPNPRRVSLDPAKCNGQTFRYSMDGWGLIQLYLEIENEGKLSNSHTNHNTLLRAKKWETVVKEGDVVGGWDFSVINKYSCRLNRQIRGLSVGKMRSRPVLPGAFGKLGRGVKLTPFQVTDFVPNDKSA